MLDFCIIHIDGQVREVLEGSELRWEASNEELKRRDPYFHEKFTYALSRVSKYI